MFGRRHYRKPLHPALALIVGVVMFAVGSFLLFAVLAAERPPNSNFALVLLGLLLAAGPAGVGLMLVLAVVFGKRSQAPEDKN